ncbi:hypothetical protein C8R46DRAFT_1102117 [Mycena filopes]|nr:hypothetical protein C8R46DRAFT_1102117 [Mycena filopes]
MDIMPPPLPSDLSSESHIKILIAASEANIARIESQIRDLERLRDRERETLARLRADLAAPVRKMPVELLAEIFRYACGWYPSLSQPRSEHLAFYLFKAAKVVSHVCAHWRQVAITTPQLWTQPPVRLNKTPTEAYCSRLKEWLGRSAPLPIHVQLACASDVNPTTAVDTFLTVAHRWSSAQFALPSLSVLSNIPSDGLKQLRKLTLESPDTSSVALAAFSLAPNLSKVTLYTPHITRLQLPWSQLAHLIVAEGALPQQCLDALLQCQNLLTAYFSIDAWPGRPDVSALTPVTLGKLERFELHSSSELGSITPLFACLALPALSRLTLSLSSDLDWTTPEFTQFQLRSPNVETLSIRCPNLDSDALIAILRHTPAVSFLSLAECRHAFDETTAAALSSSHQSHAQLVPSLCNLSVEGCDNSLEEVALDALIAARWWTDEQLATFPSPPRVARWSSIAISRDDDQEYLSSEFVAKLKEYREQGLDVNISYLV